MSPRASLRLLWRGYVFHFKHASRNPFDVASATLWPLVYATVAFLMFRAGAGHEDLFRVTIGASLLGAWSLAVASAGNAFQWQRFQGTLEPLVAAPAPFVLTLLSLTLAITTLGIYALAGTLAWARLAFGVPIHVARPLPFAVMVVAALVSIGVFGFLLATSCVLYRRALALTNVFEFPGWLLSGLLVPLALLPLWVRPLSYALAPTWGARGLRAAAEGGPVLADLGMCVLLAAAYALGGVLFLRLVLHRARASATFSLT